MVPQLRLPLRPGALTGELGRLICTTRSLIGWSQDELASRALTSQTKIWRMEHDLAGAFDLETLERVLAQLGLSVTLEVEGRHLVARAEQHDLVHAAVVGILAARLRRAGWEVALEVATGPGAPTGWIDLLAFRATDGALLVIEVKTMITDAGALLRQVARYEREATWAARRQGWLPSTAMTAVVCLDSEEIRDAVDLNRRVLSTAVPGDPASLERWLRDPTAPRPTSATLCTVDLVPRRRTPDLRRTPISGRRSAPAYAGYADAAAAQERRR